MDPERIERDLGRGPIAALADATARRIERDLHPWTAADLATVTAGIAGVDGDRLVAAIDEISYSGKHFRKTIERLANECADLGSPDTVHLVAAPLFVTEHGRALHEAAGVRTFTSAVLPPFRSTADYLALDEEERSLYASFLEESSPPVFAAFEYVAPDNNSGKWFNRVVAPLFTLRASAIK